MQKQDLIAAHQRIAPHIHRTPVLTSRLLNDMAGAELFFKCENFQKTGAFKLRGALNAIMQLSEAQRARGVVTHSSGNFAQALAYAAQQLGVKAFIVMPATAPQVKKNAVRGYGGRITECEPTLKAREQTARQIQEQEGAVFIHSSNDIDVILGQATAAKELLEVQPGLDFVFAPVGGGGLVAGTALAAHYFGRNCQTLGGEPFAADDAYRSLQSGRIESNVTTNTIADGLKTQLGDVDFPIIQRYVQRIIRVEEQEILAAMQLIWERLKIVAEPSAAVPLAALMREREHFRGKRVGLIVSGGNLDVGKLLSNL